MIENNDNAEPRMETIKHDDKTKLEETCVLVDGNNLSFVSLKERRHRSYKVLTSLCVCAYTSFVID